MLIEIPDKMLEVQIELSDDGGVVQFLDCAGNTTVVMFDCYEGVTTNVSDIRTVKG